MKLPPASHPIPLPAAIAACLVASHAPSEALSFTTLVMARQGDWAPGAVAKYDQILTNGPALNNSGRVAFGVRLDSAQNDRAIIGTGFIADAFLLRQRDPAPDANGTFQSFGQFVLNKAGAAGFVGTLSGTSGSYTQKGAFVSNTSMTQVARGGQAALWGNGTIAAFSVGTAVEGVSMNSLGEVAATVQLVNTSGESNDDVVIYRGDGGPLAQIARKGQPAPGGLSFIQLGAPSINDGSQVAFRATLTGSTTHGYFLHDGTSLIKMVGTNDPVPGGGNIFLFDNTEIPLNASGHIVFSARTSSTNSDRALMLATGAQSTVIARTGGSAPGGGTFVDFSAVDTSTPPASLNDHDAVAFQARINSNGSSNNYGLFQWDGSILHRIAIKGQAAPDGNGTFNSFENPAINANGDVAFSATLTGSAPGGIFFYEASTGIVHQVGRIGETINGLNITALTFLSLPSRGPAGNGFNDSGQIAFRYSISGNTGIALATPDNLPAPTITVERTGLTPTDFTVTWSISNNAGTDIYRSGDMINWGAPVSTNNIADSFTDSPRPPGSAFYALVPAGQTFP